MDKDGVRICVGNLAFILKDLLHSMDKDIVSKCTLNIKLLRNNIDSIEKLLGLDRDGEDKDGL